MFIQEPEKASRKENQGSRREVPEMRQNFATKVLFGNLIREVFSFVNRLVLKKSVHLRRTMSLLLSICEKTRFVITLCFLCVGEAPPP